AALALGTASRRVTASAMSAFGATNHQPARSNVRRSLADIPVIPECPSRTISPKCERYSARVAVALNSLVGKTALSESTEVTVIGFPRALKVQSIFPPFLNKANSHYPPSADKVPTEV